MTDWSGQHVIRGFAEELIDRLPADAVAGPAREEWGSQDPARAAHWSQRTAAYHGVVTWSPTVDPERLKLAVAGDGAREQGAPRLPLLGGDAARGGRQGARRDLREQGRPPGGARQGGGRRHRRRRHVRARRRRLRIRHRGGRHPPLHEHRLAARRRRHGPLDRVQGRPARAVRAVHGARPRGSAAFERPFVSWRNDIALFMGPRQSGFSALDVDDQTEVEIRSHRADGAAPRLLPRARAGLRERLPVAERAAARRAPRAPPDRRDARCCARIGRPAQVFDDEIGVTPSVSPKFPNISIPYGAWCRQQLDGLLACGRHISCDPNSHGFMREIPQCWITGQAAGVGAALAANRGIEPRAVNLDELQSALAGQGVYLRPRAQKRRGQRVKQTGMPGARRATGVARSSAASRCCDCFGGGARSLSNGEIVETHARCRKPTVTRLAATLVSLGAAAAGPGRRTNIRWAPACCRSRSAVPRRPGRARLRAPAYAGAGRRLRRLGATWPCATAWRWW